MFFVLKKNNGSNHLTYMKNGEYKLAQCPDFVIYYISIQVDKIPLPLQNAALKCKSMNTAYATIKGINLMRILRTEHAKSYYFGYLAFLFLDVDVSVGIKSAIETV